MGHLDCCFALFKKKRKLRALTHLYELKVGFEDNKYHDALISFVNSFISPKAATIFG